jgi:CRISPR-associated endoribonuclease Cas2 subtype I-E
LSTTENGWGQIVIPPIGKNGILFLSFLSAFKVDYSTKFSAVVEYLHEFCPKESGLMIFQRINRVPGYKIRGLGEPGRTLMKINGLQLVQEKAAEEKE